MAAGRAKWRLSVEENRVNEQLTPDRLFSAPSLAGDLPSDLKVSPCGEFAAFRAPSEDDQNRLNLHRVMFASGTSELWIEADTVAQTSADVTSLTAEERSDRERRRDFSHGISENRRKNGTRNRTGTVPIGFSGTGTVPTPQKPEKNIVY